MEFCRACGVNSVRIQGLELKADPLGEEANLVRSGWRRPQSLSEGAILRLPDLEYVVRLALREVIWCRLLGANGFYVHFGYDYYVYLGSGRALLRPVVVPSRLFLEDFDSPLGPVAGDD